MSELGNRVRAARAYAGDMTQKELAAKLLFSLSTLQRTEAGGRALDEIDEPGFVKAVAGATGLPPWFFTVDLDQITPDAAPSDDAVGRLEQQLRKLQSELREIGRETAGELEKQARSKASDRGRLGRIEKDLERLAQLLLEHVNDEGGKR